MIIHECGFLDDDFTDNKDDFDPEEELRLAYSKLNSETGIKTTIHSPDIAYITYFYTNRSYTILQSSYIYCILDFYTGLDRTNNIQTNYIASL